MKIEVNLVLVPLNTNYRGVALRYIHGFSRNGNQKCVDIATVRGGRNQEISRVNIDEVENEYREATIDEISDFYSEICHNFEQIMKPVRDLILSKQSEESKVLLLKNVIEDSKDTVSLINSMRKVLLDGDSNIIQGLDRVGDLRDTIINNLNGNERSRNRNDNSNSLADALDRFRAIPFPSEGTIVSTSSDLVDAIVFSESPFRGKTGASKGIASKLKQFTTSDASQNQPY